MLPGMPSAFTMFGARVAMSGGLTHIEQQVDGIERAIAENPGLAFDLAKTLVESACRSILTDRSITFGPDDDLPKLFRAVTDNLPLLPTAASSAAEARRSLLRTLNGLHTALQGIAELRNAYGFASHGSGAARPNMETVQAMLAAQAADAIIGFLYRIHRQERPSAPVGRASFADSAAFNAYIDEANEVVHIFDLVYRPSEVLFAVDQDAYRAILNDFESQGAGQVSDAATNAGAQA